MVRADDCPSGLISAFPQPTWHQSRLHRWRFIPPVYHTQKVQLKKRELGINTKGTFNNQAYILVRKLRSSDKRQHFLHALWTVLHFIAFKLLSGTRWCFAWLPTAEPRHCWWIPMVCSSRKVKRQPETLRSLYSAPQGHNPLESNLPLLLSPLLLPNQIRFLPVMLLLLAYVVWVFCKCAAIKWSTYMASHPSHYGNSFSLLLGFLHIYYI